MLHRQVTASDFDRSSSRAHRICNIGTNHSLFGVLRTNTEIERQRAQLVQIMQDRRTKVLQGYTIGNYEDVTWTEDSVMA